VCFDHPAAVWRQDVLQRAAVRVQRFARGFIARRRVRRIRESQKPDAGKSHGNIGLIKQARAIASAVILQKYWRGWKARKIAQGHRKERAATVIQARWRGHHARTRYSDMRENTAYVDPLPPPLELAAGPGAGAATAAAKSEGPVELIARRIEAYMNLTAALG
jgi:hypothetical protein